MNIGSVTDLLTGSVGAVAVLVVFLTLILAGKLHTEAEFDREVAALDREKAAHDETRKALAEAAARADAAVRASELVAAALSAGAAGPGRPHVPR